MSEVRKELAMLTCSLIKRMRLDLTTEAEDMTVNDEKLSVKKTVDGPRKWLAHPKTLRLTTRPRLPRNPDGSRPRLFNRISKSCNMPSVVFSFNHSTETIAEKVVNGSLLPLFHQLHSGDSGWDLSLVNLCAKNMALTGTDGKNGAGRDIGRMFRRQDDVLKEWRFDEVDEAPSHSFQAAVVNKSQHSEPEQRSNNDNDYSLTRSEDMYLNTRNLRDTEDAWNSEGETASLGEACTLCGATMPAFAMSAHRRFHSLPD